MADPIGIVLLALLFRKPRAIFIRFRVKNDATGTALLKLLDGHGKVVELVNFNGKDLSIIFQPPLLRPRQWEIAALDCPGVELVEVRDVAVTK